MVFVPRGVSKSHKTPSQWLIIWFSNKVWCACMWTIKLCRSRHSCRLCWLRVAQKRKSPIRGCFSYISYQSGRMRKGGRERERGMQRLPMKWKCTLKRCVINCPFKIYTYMNAAKVWIWDSREFSNVNISTIRCHIGARDTHLVLCTIVTCSSWPTCDVTLVCLRIFCNEFHHSIRLD